MAHRYGKKGQQGPIAPKGHHKVPPIQKDAMAHHSHHQANVDHGTPQGFAPDDEYQDGGSDHHLGDNEAMCD